MEKKIRKRDIKLSDLNISNAKYNELKYFCLQYDEKKQEIQNNYGIRASARDGMTRSNTFGSPTEQAAIRNVMLEQDLEMIEQAAMEADADVYKWLLKSVTQGISYEWMDVPMGRRQFYEVRRYFFYLLAQKR